MRFANLHKARLSLAVSCATSCRRESARERAALNGRSDGAAHWGLGLRKDQCDVPVLAGAVLPGPAPAGPEGIVKVASAVLITRPAFTALSL